MIGVAPTIAIVVYASFLTNLRLPSYTIISRTSLLAFWASSLAIPAARVLANGLQASLVVFENYLNLEN
jgi:hypothetical protein